MHFSETWLYIIDCCNIMFVNEENYQRYRSEIRQSNLLLDKIIQNTGSNI